MLKKLHLSLNLIIISAIIWSQAPHGFNYQAVIRDANNIILNSQSIALRFDIFQGNIGGNLAYSEMFLTSTSSSGMVNIQVGTGATNDDFTEIDWSNGPYFVETAINFLGGNPWLVMGSSQLMSVPYSLHSITADSVKGGINHLEQDPLFTASIASSITSTDTSLWNSYIDTDTQLDSVGIANYGYVAGPHPIDTDTQLDSIGIANYGYVAGPHTIDTDTQLDSTGIANYGYVAGPHTIDTDTQLDSTDIANYGYVAGPHTIDTDTQLDSTDIANYGYVAGPFIDTDTQLDSTDIANYGYVAGPHTVDTQIDSIGIANYGYVASKTYSLGLHPELGGYVFIISPDGKHGLVVEVQDQTVSGVSWYGAGNYVSNPANHSLDGQNFNDWRLPTKDELNEIYLQRSNIGSNLNNSYWTSTQFDYYKSWLQNFNISVNSQNVEDKFNGSNFVRSVRGF